MNGITPKKEIKGSVGEWLFVVSEWFFYGFLLTAILSIRKVIWFLPLRGTFNEYAGIYIYLSDIFLLVALLCWVLSIVYNNNIELSSKANDVNIVPPRYNCSTWNNLRGTRGTKWFINSYTQVIHRRLLLMWVAFLMVAGISIFFSKAPIISLFREIKLIEFSILFLYFIKIVPRGTILKRFLWITSALGVLNSVLGLVQILTQKSVGLNILRESVLAADMPGVAKIIFGGEKYIRAYGLFPHPNVLGGFLLLSIVCTVMYKKLFHPSRNVPRGTFYGAGVEQFCDKNMKNALNKPKEWFKVNNKSRLFNILFHVEHFSRQVTGASSMQFAKFVPRGTNLIYVALVIQIVGLFATVSKSASLGLLTGGFYVIYEKNRKNVPRGTMLTKLSWYTKMFHVEHFSGKILLMVAISGAVVFLLRPNFDALFLKSLRERMFYYNVSRGTIFENPLLGVGFGQFVINLTEKENLEAWQLQPVHNVFWLILTENGIVGLILFVLLLKEIFKDKIKEVYVKENMSVSVQSKCSTPIKMFHVEHFSARAQSNLQSQRRIISENLAVKDGNVCFECFICAKGLFLAYVFIMFFDHYLWDIQQGQIIFWLSLGLLVVFRKRNSEKSI